MVSILKQAHITGFIAIFPCFLSILGSAIIVNILLRSTTKLSSTYRRLMFGISIVDFFQSGVWIQAAKPYINMRTCQAEGFFLVFTSSAPALYNLSLCIYYVLTVCYEKNEKWIRNRAEPFLHGFPILWSVGFSCTTLLTDNINPTGQLCYINPLPRDCHVNDNVDCDRGENAMKYRFFLIIQALVVLFLIIISMVMLCWKVMRQEKIMKKKFIVINSGGSVSSSEDKRSKNRNSASSENCRTRRMVKQAFVYVLAYFVPNLFAILFFSVRIFSGEYIFVLWILFALIMPLQGFFNCIVFIRPRVLSMRQRFPGQSSFRIFLLAANISSEKPSITRSTNVSVGKKSSTDDSCEKKTDCIDEV